MSTKPKSQGPFVATRLKGGVAECVVIHDGDGKTIAHMFRGAGASDVNVRLLAESWNLLRAVKAAEAFLDDRAMMRRLRSAMTGSNAGVDERQELLKMLRAAIGRAEQGSDDLILDVDQTDDDDEMDDDDVELDGFDNDDE